MQLGSVSIFQKYQFIQTIIKVLGSIYLLYIAYKLSFGGQSKDKKLDPKPVTFINTFFFQFVNPKSIIVGLTSISLFVDIENNYLRDSIVLTILWFLMAVGSQTGWCLMGKYMRKFATSDKFIKNFNYTMSFKASIWFLSTVTSSSYLRRFSNNTLRDLGSFDIPSNPFFSAVFKLKYLKSFPDELRVSSD